MINEIFNEKFFAKILSQKEREGNSLANLNFEDFVKELKAEAVELKQPVFNISEVMLALKSAGDRGENVKITFDGKTYYSMQSTYGMVVDLNKNEEEIKNNKEEQAQPGA